MTEVSFAKQFLGDLDKKPEKYKSDHVFDSRSFQVRVPYTLPKLPQPPHPTPPTISASDLNTIASAPPPPSTPSPSTTQTATLTLKSTRNPSFTYTIPVLPLSTPISSIKSAVHTYLGGSATVSSVDKIKVLYNRKPVPASKGTVGDVLGDEHSGGNVEFGVMVMGGCPDPEPQSLIDGFPGASGNPRISDPKTEMPASGPGSENAAVEAATGKDPGDIVMGGMTSEMEKQRGGGASGKSEPVQPGGESGKEVLESEEFWNDLKGFLALRVKDETLAEELSRSWRKHWSSTVSRP